MKPDQLLLTEALPRLGLALLAVALAVALGAVSTLVQWPKGAVAIAPPTIPPPVVATPEPVQHFVLDGAALIPWPISGGTIVLQRGQLLEIVLPRLPDERVDTSDPAGLAVQPNGVCGLTSVCGPAQVVNRYSFVARRAGTFFLLLDYGRRCSRSLCPTAPRQVLVVVT